MAVIIQKKITSIVLIQYFLSGHLESSVFISTFKIQDNRHNSMSKNPYLRVQTSKEESVIDTSTGEVLETNTVQVKKLTADNDSFLLIYTKLLTILTDYQGTLADVKVYSYLLSKNATSDEFSINKLIKSRIADSTGLSILTVEKALSNLIINQKGYSPLLLKVGRGTYQINPMYAFKGKSTDRKYRLELLLESNPDIYNNASKVEDTPSEYVGLFDDIRLDN